MRFRLMILAYGLRDARAARSWYIARLVLRVVWRQDRYEFRQRWPRVACALSRLGLWHRVYIYNRDDPRNGAWLVSE